MDIRSVLESYKRGELTADDAERMLRLDYLDSIGGDVIFDRARQLRKGIPEVVYAASKTPETVARIASSVDSLTIVSKAGKAHLDAVRAAVPDATILEDCGIAVVGRMPSPDRGRIGIVAAGTSDIPIATEAKVMAEAMGVECITAYDIGVAGMHRLVGPMRRMLEEDVDAIVAVAGMEGALPTVISSLSPVPVIGVPVSTGYGAGGDGVAALLSMLQSCSPGLTVVNIDNGIGAGATAALISVSGRRR
ncbi:MAG: nickel pincer cofactor biosynthesis protein LarB [Candidatus Methanomethylophilaceae archaeon]|nr:nickel pincer cofactor biosynthesis protein LarB [Candidatus Methanomethylophilaceae archaeon]